MNGPGQPPQRDREPRPWLTESRMNMSPRKRFNNLMIGRGSWIRTNDLQYPKCVDLHPGGATLSMRGCLRRVGQPPGTQN